MSSNTVTKKYKIIIVDDDREFLSLLKDVLVLDDDNYNVKVFTNLVPALIFLKKSSQDYDLIITKVYSPIKYGLELAELIKKFYSNIKVIITSSFNVDKYVISQTQCDGYLPKPVSLDEMRKMIRECLNYSPELQVNFSSIKLIC